MNAAKSGAGTARAPAALDAVGVPVVILDPDGHIVDVNRACEESAGYVREELRGKRFWEMLPVGEEAAVFEGAFQEVLGGRSPRHVEGQCQTKQAAPRLLSWSLTALADAEGVVRHVVATGVDVLEHRRMEEAYREG